MPSNYTRSFAYDGPLMQSSYTTRMRKPVELMLVPMIDIFTVLVTFLLMTAVFSRITILQLDLPSSDSASAGTPPEFRLEVIVRHQGFELTNGTKLIATIPKVNDRYDFDTLTQMALSLKQEYPKANDASVLLERDVQYDYLIQAMDAIRTAEVTQPDATTTKQELFANIAVGEAP
ncbi:MAG TPA: biopolymer transporter ExbD [Steroidobacter sp.]|uniref:ExbD/TolR family protein n=1 Tax=Steroidobacter sp. TaxID=1978227 RepID=UPI002ED8918E